MIQIKRAYAAPEASDGYRILVDRIWPRGISKEKAQLDLWLKEIGPSKELRQSLHTNQLSFAAFTERYKEELKLGETAAAWQQLQQISQEHQTITLVYGSKDVAHNQALLLKQWLENSLNEG